MDQYQAAYERVRANAEHASVEGAGFKGPCAKCKHHERDDPFWHNYNAYCHHPLVVSPEFDKSCGRIVPKPKKIKDYLSGYDSIPSLCGDKRDLFEQALFWPITKALAAIAFALLAAWIVL